MSLFVGLAAAVVGLAALGLWAYIARHGKSRVAQRRTLKGGGLARTLNPMQKLGKVPKPPEGTPPPHAHLSFQQWASKHHLDVYRKK